METQEFESHFHKKILFLEKIFGRMNVRPSRDKKNINVRCPICDKNNGKLKLAIRTVDDLTHCWVCGWSSRSLIPILIKFYKDKADEYKNNFCDIKFEFEEIKDELRLPNDYVLLAAEKDRRKYFNFFGFLKSRNINEKDLWRYKFGVSQNEMYKNRIIIPSFDRNGNLNYFTARAIYDSKIRYLTCGHAKTEIIFNEIYLDFKKPIKICEGPFDMIKLGSNATCLQGSEFNENSKLFEEILFYETPVILCLDSDMKLKSQMIARKLQEYNLKVKILDLGNRHDPGELDKNEVEDLLNNNCYEYSWDRMIQQKINSIR